MAELRIERETVWKSGRITLIRLIKEKDYYKIKWLRTAKGEIEPIPFKITDLDIFGGNVHTYGKMNEIDIFLGKSGGLCEIERRKYEKVIGRTLVEPMEESHKLFCVSTGE
ncbi:hypothetical protein DRN63_05300 [Nanoarchaeota archaeon]|nr:MAG: hypothetical protein DRN63_05300 [Nanoarchaeota archaeon]